MTTPPQERDLVEAVLTNPLNATLLSALSDETLPNWFLTAGCVCQTVWNAVTGRDPTYGIEDHDVFYFDGSDLSYEAEDRAVNAALARLSASNAATVQIRNKARVHLWYEDHFGVPCAPLQSVEAGINQFLTLPTAASVRPTGNGSWGVYAPSGLDDVFSLTIRPNVEAGRRRLYEEKCASWLSRWPELTVVPLHHE